MVDPMDRRRFLRLGTSSLLLGPSAASVASVLASTNRPPIPPATDPTAALYRRLIPARKDLPIGWIRSLVERDAPDDAPIATSDKDALARIGMTVGGIGCGSVYLSGDGRLYVWDIFHQPHEGIVAQQASIPGKLKNLGGAGAKARERDGANYLVPPTPDRFPNPFRQGFELECDGITRSLDARGWQSVAFRGDWPVGRVTYADPSSPVSVKLTAWTPFIPLEADDSSWPLTVMEYEVTHHGPAKARVTLRGILENPVLCHTRKSGAADVSSRLTRNATATLLVHEPGSTRNTRRGEPPARKDILFSDFEQESYQPWTTEGTAFGQGPARRADFPAYQGDPELTGKSAVNSHASAPGGDLGAKDDAVGTLISPPFVIERRFITLRIGGGNRPGETGVELVIDDKVVATLTGPSANRMQQAVIDTRPHAGKTARLRIIDRARGPWGNTGIDHVVFTDVPPPPEPGIEQVGDHGTMVLACLDPKAVACGDEETPEGLLTCFDLDPGTSHRVTFLLAWHFPNLPPLPGLGRKRPAFAARFKDAAEVASRAIERLDPLRAKTMEWTDTWYDSSLPRWLMDRSLLTANTLQTTTCQVFDDGRFWAWEGIGCCPGTCGHVWHYAQSVARLFPALERSLREKVDLALAMNPDGGIRFRAEANQQVAIDAQTTVILRTWREHLHSQDTSFLHRVWPAVKRATEWLIRFDADGRGGLDGLLDGEQHNTLDAEWYGKVHCLCSLYLAALRAAQQMALESGDSAFAKKCAQVHAMGAEQIKNLFNGEFFVQQEDPNHRNAIGVGTGCYIDQVIGQWWAHQTGLGRIQDESHTRSALHALWHRNFVPRIGTFRDTFRTGRFYALGDEAGLVMCTWPNGGLREDFMRHWQYGYFNECMSGFEHQVAAHMVQEGRPVSDFTAELGAAIENPADPRSLTLRGLAVARAVHDRYSPTRRNPYNEIECSDHYARAAASFSLFTAACGFHHHGPKGELGFAPRIRPEHFHAPFLSAEGWGVFRQQITDRGLTASIQLRHGRLRLAALHLEATATFTRVTARLDGKPAPATATAEGLKTRIVFEPPIVINDGSILELGVA